MMQFKLSDSVNQERVFLINLSEVKERFDPYANQPRFRKLFSELRKGLYPVSELRHISNRIFSGITPTSGGSAYTDSQNGIAFIRSGEITEDGLISHNREIFIKPKIHNNMMKRSQLHKNDLLIAIVGATIGSIGIYKNSMPANINQAIAVVRLNESKVLPDYVRWYMLTNTGQMILDYLKRPVARANINLKEIAGIPLLIPPLETQYEIINMMEQAVKVKQKSEQEARVLLDSIDTYLLKELGITLPEQDNSLESRIYKASFSKIAGNRIDPEYNHFSFQSFENQMSKYPKLGDFISLITKGETPLWGGDSYIDNGIPFLQVQNLSVNGISGDYKFIPFDVHKRMRRSQLFGGEILYSMAGTIGIAIIFPDSFGESNINQAIAKIILKGYSLKKKYLVEILNSKLCLLQAQRFLTVSAQPNINFQQIKSLRIPLPSQEKQSEIVNHIETIRTKAKQLEQQAQLELDKAKQEIEQLILGN